MKNITKKIIPIILAILFIPFSVQALIAYPLNQGGTGWDTSTKGDLLVGSSSISKYSRLPVGTNGYFLTASSTSPIGLQWIATSTLNIIRPPWLVGNGFLYTATSTDGAKAAYFNATSTTATSTFSNSVTVGNVLNLSGATASTIAIFDSLKNVVSASTATFPSLTELSYGKGVTSAIQTQLNAKAPTASPTFTGTITLDNMLINGNDAGNSVTFYPITSDGSDNRSIAFGGGGAGGSNRGAYAAMRGNEFTTYGSQRGNVYFVAGEPTTPGTTEGSINFWTGTSGVKQFTFTKDGAFKINNNAYETVPAPAGSPSIFFNSTTLGLFGLVHGVLGSGTSYLQSQRVDGTATVYSLSLQPNGGNVGIGTASPGNILDAVKSQNGQTDILVQNTNAGSSAHAGLRTTTDSGDFFFGSGSNASAFAGGGYAYTQSNVPYTIWTNNAERVRVQGNGYVGIGTTTASSSLTVAGSNTSTVGQVRIAGPNGSTEKRMIRYESTGTGAADTMLQFVGNTATSGNFGMNWFNASSSSYLMFLRQDGNLGIGSTSPAWKLTVAGTMGSTGLTSSGTGNAVCIATTGEFLNAGGGTCTPSSIKYKENTDTIENGFALNVLNKLRAVSFDYKNKEEYETNHSYGVIAEEVEKIDPNLVDYNKDGEIYGVHFEKITGLLIQAVQELSVRQGIAKAKRSVEENWQWAMIAILALFSVRQQYQIKKLTK